MRLAVRAASSGVRYIGVDTPETAKPDAPAECFGSARGAFNERLVGGREVRLERDVEERDRYGRLLAYVHAGDGRSSTPSWCARATPQPLTVPPNVRFAERFARLARDGPARADRGPVGFLRGHKIVRVMRMRQSLAEIEEAFVEEIEEDRERRERLARRAERRTRQRHIERAHKQARCASPCSCSR